LQATEQEVTERRMKPTNIKIKAALIKLEETMMIWIWETNTYSKIQKKIIGVRRKTTKTFMSCPCQ